MILCTTIKLYTMETSIDVKSIINEARQKYKPEKIKLLFVAEAPPDSLDRFFYYEHVMGKDYLFIELTKALFKIEDPKVIRGNKAEILKHYKNNGLYLMDLSDEPIPSVLKDKSNDFHIDYYIRKDLKRLFMKKLAEEKAVDRKNTIIILIKVSVYDYLFKELRRNGYKVCDVRIPFPSTGNQKRFAEAMLKVEEELKGL